MQQTRQAGGSKTTFWAPTLAVLVLAILALAGAAPAAASEFMLRAPAAQINAIAATHGLSVLDEIDVSQDALGRRLYLVESAPGIDPAQVIADVLAMEPEAAGMERAVLASVPESFLNPSNAQDISGLLALLADDSEILFGDNGDSDSDSDSDDRPVWQGYVDQPAAHLINVPLAQADYRGDATVAIIDTGIDPNHPLLAGSIVAGCDFVGDDPDPSEWGDLDQSTAVILDQSTAVILDQSTAVILDQSTAVILDTNDIPVAFGHGTMVAGIVHRVAPEARLMPLKAFDGDGHANLFDIVRAIYYAVDSGANAINMSFSVETFSPELMRAINYAARNGVACIAAAGNQGQEMLVFPAALGNTIGVASTAGNDVISPFSNFGSDLVTVAAPGEQIITTYPGGGWAMASGTSFSAPWVTGAVALFADKNGTKHAPGSSDYYLSSDALSYAFPVHGVDNQGGGYGRVDLDWAMDELESD